MTETFLILLAGGILFAAAVANPFQVTLQWLRLAGILALALGGVSIYFLLRRGPSPGVTPFFERMQEIQALVFIGCTLAQLATVQLARRQLQRLFAGLGFLVAVLAGTAMLHDAMTVRGSAMNFPPKAWGIFLQTVSCGGVALMTGLALMDMLLGHAYLTASRMQILPFERLNLWLAGVLLGRFAMSVIVAVGLQLHRPVAHLWNLYGLYIGTRWLVGLVIPAVFVYMAHDCIKRRSTQAATGILYVTGVLIFIGELLALYLVRETGLPF